MSTTELIVTYLAQRARLRALVPLALVIAWVASTGATRVAPASVVVLAAQAFALVLAFRIWDDLEDRERDAREHPQRVLPASKRTAPFAALIAALALVGALSGSRVLPRVTILGAVALVLVAWYRLRRADDRGVAGGHVVLLKYPAIAFAIAPAPPRIAAVVSLYLGLCVFESFDDPALRGSRVARRLALTELMLLPLILATASYFGGGPS